MNLTILLLAAVAFVVVAVMTVTGPLLPLIAEEFGRSVGQVGIIVTRSCRRAAAARVAALPIAITRPETRASAAIAHRKNGRESRVLMALVARDYSES